MRAAISIPRLAAAPHNAEDNVKMMMQIIRNRLRPKKRPNQFVAGRMIAFETR
jgi:hypothetical protein